LGERESASPVETLLREVRAAARRPRAARTLLLDVDGTLAPIAPTPEQAAVPARTIEALRGLVESAYSVVVVSGRAASEVRRMLPVRELLVFGSHGAERPPGFAGAPPTPPSGEALERLARIRSSVGALAERHPGVRLEPKPAGLAIHDRALGSAEERRWRAALGAWLTVQDLAGLEVLEGKRVVELRPHGVHKGLAVVAVAKRLGGSGEDASFLAIGDDATDEDMFREMRGRGLGVHVGPAGARTLAERRLDSPEDVGEFLLRLAEAGRD
jgi:trehalose-phosphatase